MRIASLHTSSGPFKEGLDLTLETTLGNLSQNFATVLVGANGSSKSLALRLLTDAGLGINKFESPGYYPLHIEIKKVFATPISKVIAVSGTPLDRFPRGGRPGPVGMPTQYDFLPYIYIGQKASNGMAGSRQSERGFAYLLLRHYHRISKFSKPLAQIFTRLELPHRVQLHFTPKPLSHHDLLNTVASELNSLSKYKDKDFRLPPELQEVEIFANRLLSDDELAERIREIVKLLKNDSRAATLDISKNINPNDTIDTLAPNWKLFHLLAMLRIITFKEISFESDNSEKPFIRGDDLSSGQWHWLSSLCGVLLEGCDDSLILVDEPENSLHPNWQREYLPALLSVLSTHEGCHLVIATHSPLIAASLPQDSGAMFAIRKLNREGNSPITQAYPLEPTFGWNATDILEQVFSMESTRSPEFLETADAALSYIADGKEKHRKELKSLATVLEQNMSGLPAHDPMRRVVQSIVEEVNDHEVGEK